jgi:hypothetical protein
MPLKTTSTLPPGGWVYEQKDNAGKIVQRFRSFSPFNEAASEIFNFRRNNGFARASLDEVKEDLEQAQCARLGYDPDWCIVKKNSPTPKPFVPSKLFAPSLQHLREGVGHAAKRLKDAAVGIRILADWFGEGADPVAPQLAQTRADLCTGGFRDKEGKVCPCPFNQPGYKPVEAVAEKIREQVEKKKELNLFVLREEGLHSCKICWCHLPLKVHVPLSTIMGRTPDAMMEKFRELQPACWMVTEQPTTKT